ncbi:hypothetical protein [Variovorax sp. YR216]|uniref:hypothetical protein n=1 Tax=Variovorax sp. YR216 TaxID=1882828 RepID=UPI000894CA57|nr:hypothetical protein [Variovorax sp. YR216]SEA00483.1 hypothetical protein SAMN05444680_101162 [Variovorax sp. YR216]
MQRERRGELTQLYQAVVVSRLAVEAARGELIEALGDWLCGADTLPPGSLEMQALARLCEAQEKAEAEYAKCVSALSEKLVQRARVA